MEQEARPEEATIGTYPEHMHPAFDFPNNHTYQRELSQGSEGTVALWSHNPTGHLLAVKSLERRARTKNNPVLPNEVAILKDLPLHDKVTRIEAFYTGMGKDGQDCIIFEYLPKGDLFELRELSYKQGKNGIFSEKFMWSLYSQLSAALAFLHEGIDAPPGTNTDYWQPIVHRDIKVENIFIKTLGNQPDWSSLVIKLGDFGHATVYNDDNLEMPIGIGTPDVWPPEITMTERPYGPAADVWAAGCVIHELAHGFPPVDSVKATGDYIVRERRDLLPWNWAGWSQDRRNWFLKIMSLRRPLPINVDPDDQAEDPRTHRPCPKYSDALSACMMMALRLNREERARAGALKDEVEAGYANFLYEELMEENKRLVEEEKAAQNRDRWDEESDDSYISD
jgi:NIMA (never in mitosis gene a)-related kinase